jgi:DNA-binding NarL/FixJ family response regulator
MGLVPDNRFAAVSGGDRRALELLSSMTSAATESPLRVAVVEDDHLFRDLLRIALDGHPGFTVVAALANAAEALTRVPQLRPDVLVLDIELGAPPNGIEVARRLRDDRPELGVVILSNHSAPEFVASLPLGPAGWSYLLKTSVRDVAALERAIYGAASGMITLDPQLVRRAGHSVQGPLARLTPRQLEVLQLIAQGYNNAGIARRLVVTERTVENQVSLLYRTLGADQGTDVSPRVKAVLIFLQQARPASADPRLA